MKKQNLSGLILLILSFSFVGIANANDDDEYGWGIGIYDNSIQEGRNICIGVMAADHSEPGVESELSLGRHDIDKNTKIVFENQVFYAEDAIAVARSRNIETSEKYTIYLFLIIDECVADEENKYTYQMYDRGFPENYPNDISYDDIEVINYEKTNEDCQKIDENTCSTMDLGMFYLWNTGWGDDDDTPESDDDNDDNDSSDDDNDDDECNCGCDISGRATSFPLALFMFAVGIVAWAISRRTLKK